MTVFFLSIIQECHQNNLEASLLRVSYLEIPFTTRVRLISKIDVFFLISRFIYTDNLTSIMEAIQ